MPIVLNEVDANGKAIDILGSKSNLKASTERREINRYVATVIIHGAAATHAVTALVLGSLAGPVLTPMTAGLIFALGIQCSANFTKKTALKLAGKFAGLLAGVSIAETLTGIIPGIGNMANAIATFVVTEGIGFATLALLRENIDSKGELSGWDKMKLSQFIEKALDERKDNKKYWDEIELAFKRMGESDKRTGGSQQADYNKYMKILTDIDAEDLQRREAQIQLGKLLEPYGIKI